METVNQRNADRLRRAVRHLVSRARQPSDDTCIQAGLDLLAYLRPEAKAIVEDEVTRTLSDLMGSD